MGMKAMPILLLVLVANFLLGAGIDPSQPFTLTTLLGETYRGCRLVKVTPEALTISHENGVTKIPFENLGDDWKKRFSYTPEKARAFQKEEAERIAAIEAQRKKAREENDRIQSRQMAEMALAESNRLRMDEAIARQRAEAAAAAALAGNMQPGLMTPLPGTPVPVLGGGIIASSSSPGATTTVESTTEILVPSVPPLGPVYTPGPTTTQRVIIHEGTVFTPGDGTIFYLNPGYSGYVPGYVYPPPACPPRHIITHPPRSGFGATIHTGSGSIRIGR